MARRVSIRRWLKILALLTGGLILLLILLGAGILATLQTEAGRRRAAEMITSALSSDDFILKLQGLGGRPPFTILLQSFTVADREGVWLSGKNLDVEWSWPAVLKGRLHFPKITLEQLTLHRSPQAGKKPDGQGFDLKGIVWPKASVDRLAVRQIVIAPAVAGAERTFSLQGVFDAGGPEATVKLSVQHLDGSLDRLNLEARLSGTPAQLDLRFEFQEQPGGLAGELLRLPRPTAINMLLHGAGPLTGWRGELTGQAEGLFSLASSISLEYGRDVLLGWQGKFKAEEGLIPEETAGLISREVRFNLRGRLKPPESLTLEALSLENEQGRFILDGGLDLGKKGLQMRFSAAVSDPVPFLKITGLSLEKDRTVTGSISGTLLNPVIDMKAEVGRVSYEKLAVNNVSLALRFSALNAIDTEFKGLRASGRINLSGLALPWISEPPDPLQIRFNLTTAKLDQVNIRELELQSPWLEMAASGEFFINDLTLEAKTKITLSDLARLRQFHRTGLSGKIITDIAFSGRPFEGWFKVTAGGQVMNFRGLPRDFSGLAGEDFNFAVQASVRRAVIEIEHFEAKGNSAFSAKGLADLEAKKIDLAWKLGLQGQSDLARRYSMEITEPSVFEGRVWGPLKAFALEASSNLDRLAAFGRQFSNTALKVTMTGLPELIQGQFGVTTSAMGEPLSAEGDFYVKDVQATLRALVIKAAGAELAGNLIVGLKNGLVHGTARLKTQDLSRLSRLAGQTLAGSADMNLTFDSSAGKQALVLQGQAIRLAALGFRIGRMSIQARSADLYKLEGGRAEMDMSEINYRDLSLTKTKATVEGGFSGLRFQAGADGSWRNPFSLQAQGELHHSRGLTRLTLKELSGKYNPYRIYLAHPVLLEIKPSAFLLEGLDLQLGQGRLQGGGNLTTQATSFNLNMENLPLALLNLISPVSITGSLSGQIVIRGNPSSPELSSKIVLAGLKPIQADLKNLPQAEVKVDVHLDQGLLTTQAQVSGFGPEPGQADLKLPLKVSLNPFQLDTQTARPLEGRLRATLDLGLIPALFSWDDQKVAGLALVDFSLSGTINNPQVSGSMSIQKGRYENLRSGTIIKDISAEMKAQGDEIRLTSLRASDGEKGLITADGVIKLETGRKFPFQYQVTINQAKLVRLDMLSAVVSGSVNAAGDTSRIQLTGKTKVDTAEVNIPKTLPPQLTEIKVKEINLAPGQNKSPPPPSKRPTRLRLEVEADFPGKLYIRGRGLDSEWKGALKVQGSASKPVLNGTMSVVRGRYTLLGRVFDLKEGQVNFQGESPPAPLINVTAEAAIQETTARIRITGSTATLKLDLESEPPMLRDEILSRVLFGESLAKISPVQAISLAQAVNELFGGPGPSLDVLGRARKLLGIDVLDVRQGEEGTVVGVGKYIGEKIYVEARKGASPSEDKVAVEIDLGRNFSLESEVGVSAGSGLRFNWKYDY